MCKMKAFSDIWAVRMSRMEEIVAEDRIIAFRLGASGTLELTAFSINPIEDNSEGWFSVSRWFTLCAHRISGPLRCLLRSGSPRETLACFSSCSRHLRYSNKRERPHSFLGYATLAALTVALDKQSPASTAILGKVTARPKSELGEIRGSCQRQYNLRKSYLDPDFDAPVNPISQYHLSHVAVPVHFIARLIGVFFNLVSKRQKLGRKASRGIR
jgi:hypothetical protein